MKKLKLNIQMFGSTNKTTHYELSQYVGTDKPTYLVDYNQDMTKIDTGIYDAESKATENASSIGDLNNLTTTAKSNLVAAINEVESETNIANTNIGDLTNLTTTAKSDIVSAINEVDSETATIGDLTNLTTTAKSDLVSAINEVDGNVGNLVNLTTTAKSDLVSAINEVDGEIGNLTNLTTTDKSSLVNAINEIETQEIGITGHILWTNPNPTSSFTPQNITLSSGDYDELTIFFKKTNTENKLDSIQILKGYSTDLDHVDGGASFFRSISYLSDTSYQIYEGKFILPGSSTIQTDNTRCVPIYVIGYKTGLFS